MSNIESSPSVARAAPRQYSFGQAAIIFLVVNPPISTPLFFLAATIANHDSLADKIDASLGMLLSVYGWLTCYAIGIVPSLITARAYVKSYDYRRPAGLRLLVATLLGALVYLIVYLLALFFLEGGKILLIDLVFSLYGAGAGAVASFICALIMDTCVKPMSAR
ncbi:hypothetical protein [Bradyrhizobium tropiciagri]|uniref:hypothetical protein n=1 Tax=Bradyrhizobium tropiciagri TaxID=312253 RepID=UPI001009D6AC|nr:hypothetical protein [Bradyrhizobium tropiciagri]